MKSVRPPSPYKRLNVAPGGSITLETSAKVLVIPTGNQNVLPSFNEYVLSTTRCDLTETPCGGLKNSIVQDNFPGSLSIVGDGCYLQNTAGTYTGKTIGAGKLSETSSIADTGNTGVEFATADGIIFRAADGEPFLIHPPSSIVEEFQVVNISNVSTTYNVTIRCPDEINAIELYNIDTGSIETVTFTKVSNSYTFSRTINYNSSEKLQLTIQYQSLIHSTEFTDDANVTTGLQNLSKSFIAFYGPTSSKIDFIHFTHRPKQLSYKQESDGTISQITIFPGNGQVYHGRITHSAPTRVSGTGTVPDCLNASIEGSVTKFLQSHGMVTDFSSDAAITTWVVPAVSDTKILPLSTISDDYLGDTITIRASPGEYTCASFVVTSDMDINLDIYVSILTSGANTLLSENVDITVVKCWYQGGRDVIGYGQTWGKYITPELLLHDDTLVVSTDDWSAWDISNTQGKNYLKLENGTYIDISTGAQNVPGVSVIPIADRIISDAKTLQTVHITKNNNTQFWATIHTPVDANVGTYIGVINIKYGNYILKQISLNIEVLPITLHEPNIEYSIHYKGKLTELGSISSEDKTIDQFTEEMNNLLAHGITNPTIFSQIDNTALSHVLSIRQQLGIDNTNLYYLGMNIGNFTEQQIIDLITLSEPYGVQQVYIYGFDEDDLNTSTIRDKITTAKSYGVKIFCAEWNGEYIANIADMLDLVIAGVFPSSTYSSLYHTNNHRIYLYGQPQVIPEFPLLFRRNYGLLLWQRNYDGAMDYAYQQAFGDIWDDFDSVIYRDFCFTYPTKSGVINTIQYEGFREAVNDMRYLATLQYTITTAQAANVDTSGEEAWLTTLKIADLTTLDLDEIRGQMIDYILALQETI